LESTAVRTTKRPCRKMKIRREIVFYKDYRARLRVRSKKVILDWRSGGAFHGT
jgi:hypothetical protein